MVFTKSTVTIFIFAVLCCCDGLYRFDNVVQPSCDQNADQCTFTLILDYMETMVFMNETRHRGNVVIDQNGTLYKRTPDERQCNSIKELTNEETDHVFFGDGTYRLLYAINKQVPGPSIIVYEGTEVIIKVENFLINEHVSIHWHGIDMEGTPWMDGVAEVTQCGIAPHGSFTYRFTPKYPGTYWYHSHVGDSRQEGLAGAFIVLERELDATHADYLKTVINYDRGLTSEEPTSQYLHKTPNSPGA